MHNNWQAERRSNFCCGRSCGFHQLKEIDVMRRFVIVLFISALVSAAFMASAAVASPPPIGGKTTYIPSSVVGSNPLTSGWHCDEVTCIDVLGTGLNISALDAEGQVVENSGCVYPLWYDYDGDLSVYGNTVCWNDGPGSVYSYKPASYYLPNGDQVCLVWLGQGAPDGNPCVSIHS